jgi:hypothetical protein
VTKPTPSKGASFAQGGGNGQGGKKKEAFDKACSKGKTCFKCDGKDHPANHCPKSVKAKKTDDNDDDDDDDAASAAQSVNKLKKDFKKMSKAFTTVNAKLEQLKESESDLSDEEEASHFQHDEDGVLAFQFAQLEAKFEPRISSLFKQSHGNKIALDLKEIMLLDSQSTMDLFCSPKFADKIHKSATNMRLKSNGGPMMVGHKAKHPGHVNKAWFDTVAITNVMALLNDVIQQWCVTCDSNEMMFVVHREPEKPNMEFRMHSSGLHCYDPCTEKSKQMVFVNMVAEHVMLAKQEIKDAEVARSLCHALDGPSMKDHKWIILSHQIKDSPVTVQEADVAVSIWGKNVSKLEGTAT